MSETEVVNVNVGEILAVLKDRIGQLELDNAILAARLKSANGNGHSVQPESQSSEAKNESDLERTNGR